MVLKSDCHRYATDDSAPSPKRSRNRLGSLNAARKMSLRRPAPRKRPISMSRTNPKMRDAAVQTPTPKIFLAKDMASLLIINLQLATKNAPKRLYPPSLRGGHFITNERIPFAVGRPSQWSLPFGCRTQSLDD